MADFRVLDDVQRLFPEVTEAVDEYRKIRSDREIRGIARSLANEEALYSQFARKLSLLSQSSTHTGSLDKGSLDKLGDGTTDFVLSRLQEMEDLLKKLKADLNNFSVSAVGSNFVPPFLPPTDGRAGCVERNQNKGN
jgi:Xaa-Pro aminopeptidase